MVNISENAINELKAYFEDKDKSPIRVYLAPGGCSGPRMALALDQANENDEVVEHDGFTFVVEKELYEQAKPISIDISYMGFTVDSALPLGGGSCGSSCGSGGCGTDSSGGCCC
ncbi:IscA/HesB family protein [Oceanidesulfovibrio marinus]|uniref:Core domain-containing protein n=1 Tax=Oceanidesulfovibrio marinus TaxID=370038 RepID=A0A6P1ZJ93_9BACT|nr:IscA/HesB family protein [Oceanidesulfovibrio marinus]QJT08166.1 hypothetical protein E8L03_04165 [Oceanidesulfovibrio marinus]TVM35061.1 hypothetical protein DQK91_06580 [Oceanidesulfovibrio marinus]